MLETLGDLITTMLQTLRERTGRTMTDTMVHASEVLQVSQSTIHKWRDNSIKPHYSKLETLVAIGIAEAKMDRAWAEIVLQVGKHPQPETILDRFFAPRERVRHNLPRQPYAPFFRHGELNDVRDKLAVASSQWVIPVVGINGLGKSTLALELAWYFVLKEAQIPEPDRFTNIVFVFAKRNRLTSMGTSQTNQEVSILDEIYSVMIDLHHYADAPAATPQQKKHTIDNLLENYGRTLLIIDDVGVAADAQVTAFLELLPASTKVLLTTEWNNWPSPIRLELLSDENIRELIQTECTSRGVTLPPDQLDALAKSIGGLPLAAWWAASQIALYGYGVKQVLDKLQNAHEKLLPFVFDDIIQGFRKKNPIAYYTLLALSFFSVESGTTFEVLLLTVGRVVGYIPSLAHVLNLDPATVRQISKEECDAALLMLKNFQLALTGNQPQRSTVMRLAVPYLQAQAKKESEWEKSARTRWLNWYLAFASEHGQNIGHNWYLKYDEVEAEWQNLVCVSDWCISENRYQSLATLWLDTDSVARFTDIYGHWQTRRNVFGWLAKTASVEKEWVRLATALLNLAMTLLLMYHPEDVKVIAAYLEEAWLLCEEHADEIPPELVCLIAEQWAFFESRRKNFAEAKQWMTKVHDRLDDISNPERPRREAGYWYRLGTIHYFEAFERDHHTPAYEIAQSCFDQAFTFGTDAGRQRVVLASVTWLAEIAIAQGRYDDAREWLEKYLPDALRNKEQRRIASFYRAYAHLERHLGNLPAAQENAKQAYATFTKLGMELEIEQVNAIFRKIEELLA